MVTLFISLMEAPTIASKQGLRVPEWNHGGRFCLREYCDLLPRKLAQFPEKCWLDVEMEAFEMVPFLGDFR